jgi:hypothetical protein
MKTLLIVLAALMIPTMVMAGNLNPRLYLEVYPLTEEEVDPGPVPAYVCVHPVPTVYPWYLQCWALRVPYGYYAVPLHIGKLDQPICPTTGMDCIGFGGYLGCGFGVTATGTGTLTFMSWNACPGFLKGPSAAGEPAACLASSTRLCHDWYDHEGYLLYMNGTNVTASKILTIVASADLGHAKAINCHNMYDDGTTIGGGAQISPTQTIVCEGSPTAVTATTWGAIKGLYR